MKVNFLFAPPILVTQIGRRAVLLALALMFSVSSTSADQLWNNGDTDGSSTMGWGQYSSTLDDFYVPGGGWRINRTETIGFFITPSATISDVDIVIWPHDMAENGPDGDTTSILNVTHFEATPTGRTFLDREEIKITVDFDETYLKGQRYYWIEFTVRDQYGIQDFKFLSRRGISHKPAWTHFGQGSISPSEQVYGTELDLSYVLYGNPIKRNPVLGDLPYGLTTKAPGSKTKQLPFKVLGGNAVAHTQVIDEFAIRCPEGTFHSPFEMPIYDNDGLFVVGYETVWFCLPDDLEPEG